MTWEIAIVVGTLGAAFILLLIGFNNRDEQENRFPMQLVFITLAMLFAVSSLRMNSLIVQANNATINNVNITNNLILISDQGYIVMNWVFYLFIVVTVLSLLVTGVVMLSNRFKTNKFGKYNNK